MLNIFKIFKRKRKVDIRILWKYSWRMARTMPEESIVLLLDSINDNRLRNVLFCAWWCFTYRKIIAES